MNPQQITTTDYEIVPMAKASTLINKPALIRYRAMRAIIDSGNYSHLTTESGPVFSSFEPNKTFNFRFTGNGTLSIDDFAGDGTLPRKEIEFLLARSKNLRLEETPDSLIYKAPTLYPNPVGDN